MTFEEVIHWLIDCANVPHEQKAEIHEATTAALTTPPAAEETEHED